jgi:citrate synthase
MSKLESDLRNVFKNIFKLNLRKINKKTNYKNTKNWDSLNHVKLIMAIESKFKISIDPDQSINFISFDQILKYLRKNVKH